MADTAVDKTTSMNGSTASSDKAPDNGLMTSSSAGDEVISCFSAADEVGSLYRTVIGVRLSLQMSAL
jgi:hypothetical protein